METNEQTYVAGHIGLEHSCVARGFGWEKCYECRFIAANTKRTPNTIHLWHGSLEAPDDAPQYKYINTWNIGIRKKDYMFICEK